MSSDLRDHCISLNNKNARPSIIFRTVVRCLITDKDIFLKTAKDVREAYPIINAMKG